MDRNWMRMVFIFNAATTGIGGLLINLGERYLPISFVRTYRYGKFAAITNHPTVAKFEVPKRWFAHFYVFAAPTSSCVLALVFYKYVCNGTVPEIVYRTLDLLLGTSREALVSPENTVLATVLLTIQCWKRFYETHHVSIFSDTKINVFHYVVGFVHYVGALSCLIGESYGFVRESQVVLNWDQLTYVEFVCSIVFIWSSYKQLTANFVLANLRKNENGEAPPPGAYDPKLDITVKGHTIDKSERFLESKSASSSIAECSVSVSNKGAATPTFRTPQLPRKRVIVKPSNLSCPKGKLKSTVIVSKYNSKNEVADLKVECHNKDKTILEYEKQIDEITHEKQKLEEQLMELNKKQTELIDQHGKDLEAMAKLQQDILSSHDEKSKTELETLRLQLAGVLEEYEGKIQSRMEVQNELDNRVTVMTERIMNLEAKLEEKREMEETVKHLNDLKLESELNELRESKERVVADFTKLKLEKERQLCDFEEEMRQLGSKNNELRETLEELEKNRDIEIAVFNDETSKLKADIDNSSKVRYDLEQKLEKWQQLILELQSQLSALECELDEVKAEDERLVTENKQQIADLVAKHEHEVTELRSDLQNLEKRLESECQEERTRRLELERKTKQSDETNEFLTQELQEVQTLYKTARNNLEKVEEELKLANELHVETLKNYSDERKALEILRLEEQSKLKQFEEMIVARDNEIATVKEREKERADKIIKNAEAVTRETLAACRAESVERVKRAIAESKRMDIAMQEDMRLAAEKFEARLASAEEDKATLEKKLAEKEMEIERLSAAFDELKSSTDIQVSFNQSLQAELDRTEADLADKKEELRAFKDQICAEAGEMVARRRWFEVIMTENQASVEALSQRILQSNVEIERLQQELKCGEVCVNNYRDLLTAMRNSSKLVYEQMSVLMDQLDTKKDAIDQLQIESIAEMNAFKSCYEAKLENFKEFASTEVGKIKNKCDKTEKYNEELRRHLDEMAGRLGEARNMLVKMEERNDAQVLEISKLQLAKDKIEQQLKNLSKIVEENNVQRAERSIQHKISINETNRNIENLSMKISEIKEDHNYSKEGIAMYEQERIAWQNVEVALIKELELEKERRQEAEEKFEQLSETYKSLKRDHEELSDKYAELLGHQNQKQKIKHVSQLKDEILRLKQDLELKNKTIEQQQKTIEKLKSEEKRSFTKGKENLQVSKNASSTPISSPLKPVTPLRDRNE